MSEQRGTAYGWLVAAVAIAVIAGAFALAWKAHSPSSRYVMAQGGREIPADLQVIVSQHSKLFHIKGCTLIHQDDNPHVTTAAEAVKEGYVPCVRCLGAYVSHVAATFMRKVWTKA